MAKTTKKRQRASMRTEQAAEVNENEYLLLSYSRFSFAGQKQGRSEDRQQAAWNEFVARVRQEHPERIYRTDALPTDQGMSAFYGDHRRHGHLGAFLTGIGSGQYKVIPGRTILFVEEPRRLSREGSQDALQNIIFTLFNAGISLRFSSGLEFSTDIIREKPGWLGILTTLLDLAYEESRQKRDWLNDVWQDKRQRARDNCDVSCIASPPYWLKIVGREYKGDKIVVSGKCEIIPAARKALIKMFKLAADGLGYDLITQRLNEDAQTKNGWIPPKRKNRKYNLPWNRRYVQNTLRNREVIGEYQPHRKVGGKYGKRVADGPSIAHFYPNVLEKHPGLFELVQQKLASKRGISQSGPKRKYSNALTGLTRCGYCGGPVYCGPKGRNALSLYCHESKARRPPSCGQTLYQPCLEALLEQLRRLKPELVLPKKSGRQELCAQLRKDVAKTIALIEEKQNQMRNFNQRIGNTQDEEQQNVYEQFVITLRREKMDAEKHLAQLRSQLIDAERDADSFKEWRTGLDELKRRLDSGDVEVRARLNDHLRQFIEYIEVFPRGYPDEFLDGNCDNAIRELYERVTDGQYDKKFLRWAVKRLQSRHARFLRVHLRKQTRTQETEDESLRAKIEYLDITPEGSIGGAFDAIKDLWNQYQNLPKRKRAR